MDELETQVRDELAAIADVLEEMLGRRSRWNGELELSYEPFFRGKMSWRGGILLRADLARAEPRWRTLLHELLHTFSIGLNPEAYTNLRGWEEGTVEQLQRLIRPTVLARLGLNIPEETFAVVEADHPYNLFILALEQIRNPLDLHERNFYEQLLDIPLLERPGYIMSIGIKSPIIEPAEFRRIFAVSFTALRRGIL